MTQPGSGESFKVLAHADLARQRRDICRTCASFTRRAKMEICAVCKCYVPVKVRFVDARCPLDRW